MKYAIVEISGKQYLAEPGKEFLVANLGEVKSLECDKVLLVADGENIEVGKPYLKETLKFEVVGMAKTKIRVAKFHAKANYRRVTGAKNTFTKVKLAEKAVKKA
jgi:large subunit ribosomal protein L21